MEWIMDDRDMSRESLVGTFGQVIDDVRELFREEVALARAEIRQEVSALSSAAVQIAVGVVAGWFALMLLLLGVALVVPELLEWPVWSGFMLTGAVIGIGAIVALQRGRRTVRTTSAVPQQALASLKETKAWMQSRMNSASR
jgi:hypothetical protein